MPFRNRTEAGRELAKALLPHRNDACTVLALPRGGVPVAAEVATALGAALDLVLVRKLGVPYQPELAMGAVVDGPEPIVIRNEDVIALSGVTAAEFASVCERELEEIERRRARYLTGRPSAELSGRVVIVVDDGIATGATARAALRAIRRRNPKKLILAVPVGPTETIAALRPDADEIVCLEVHDHFGAIGLFYADFRQVSDQEVVDCLARSRSASIRGRSSPGGVHG